jgi:protein O-mannosyl-transferase
LNLNSDHTQIKLFLEMTKKLTLKRKRHIKNTPDPSSHFNSLNEAAQLLDGEANKTLKIVICMFLMVATFCIYSQVQDHEFINYDDNFYITNNVNVQAGFTIESVKWAFTNFNAAFWFPMTWFSYMLDYQLYGLNPSGYLLTNLFFHIANSLLLFLVLFRMTGAIWQSAFVATMFAFHPINIESVAWAAERKNVLSTLFWLLTMWAYIHYAEKPTVKRYGFVFLFFAMGLMSKPMLVTLPFVLLLLDYWPLRRLKFEQERGGSEISEKDTAKISEFFRLVLEKIPLFLLTAAFSIVTFIAQKSHGNMGRTLYSENLTLTIRLTNAIVSYLEYLGKMIWPSGLSVFYPHPGNTLVVWKGILCGVVLVSITIISIRLIKKAPYFAVGWFWYLGTLVPVIGLVPVGSYAMADRYTYVPLIGIFIVVAWGLPELVAKWSSGGKVLAILAAIWIPALMLMTWMQVGHWKNTITIFKHAIRVTDNNAVAHNNLGVALFSERKLEESISHFKTAIKIKPYYADPHYNLGNAFLSTGRTKEAIFHYKTATSLKPGDVDAHFNLGNAFVRTGRTKEAIFHYKTAIMLNPYDVDAHYNLGFALAQKGNLREAVSHYRETVRLRPDHLSARKNLEMALLRLEKYKHKQLPP